jgi:hypothetical protein
MDGHQGSPAFFPGDTLYLDDTTSHLGDLLAKKASYFFFVVVQARVHSFAEPTAMGRFELQD